MTSRVRRAPVESLLARAAPLAERLRAAPVADASAAAEARLRAWRRLVARDDDACWSRRLAFDALEPERVRAALGPVRLREHATPPWLRIHVAACTEARQEEKRLAAVGPATEGRVSLVPFGDALLPFVAVAREELARRAGAWRREIADTAMAQLEHALLRQLSELAVPTLYAGFAACGGGRGPLHPPESGASPRRIYTAFVQSILDGGYDTLCTQSAALMRLLATRTAFWVDATADLLRHLSADRAAISHAFAPNEELGPVAAIDPDLSDSHAGGRMVAVLHFASGLSLVYKPRPLGPERCCAALVEWANARGARPALRTLRVLDRGTYGWMEYGAAAPDADPASVTRYARRAGMLACAMYLVGATDLHSGNVLAAGEHPLLVDLEMVMQPTLEFEGIGDDSALGSWRQLRDSVLATNLFPLLHRDASGATYSDGGFISPQLPHGARTTRWEAVNTDAMALIARRASRATPPLNAPPDVTAPTACAALIRGFRHMYGVFVRHRDELLHARGPLAPFRSLRVRLILRPTSVYGAALRRALRPASLASGADRSIELDVLKRPFVHRPQRHRLWPALRREEEELERGDVPLFYGYADGNGLHSGPDGAALVPGYTERTGWQNAVARVNRLGPADLRRQTHLIRVSCVMDRVRAERRLSTADMPPLSDDVPLSATAALAEAQTVAGTLDRLAVPARDGGVTWAALDDRGLSMLQLGLAHGRSGVAFFLGALDHVTGDTLHRATARAAIAPLLAVRGDDAAARVRAMRRSHGLGGARGIGGIVYALTRLARWLDEPAALDAALCVARGVSDDAIRRDRALDVFSGAAGALLGLLALFDATGEEWVLARAIRCGRHLLARRSADASTGLDVWATIDGESGGGFAHGAAGIAYALARLHAYTGDAATAGAVRDAHAFECTLYVPQRGTWVSTASRRDQAVGGAPLLCGWCHGAPGIGLSRLGTRHLLGAEADIDVQRALSTLAALDGALPPQDHLCCGNSSRITMLQEAGIQLESGALRARAGQLAARVVVRARRRATYGAGSTDEGFAPSLFFGTSGIGYTLLRLHHHERLPAVLLWA
ncbi:MAG TPA: type 2 lanthipeptide synthetase LanM [Gemmatimonadaceae bacterium]|nr:type 2 lanthipeptide synthetase LanM [Gemmatimonadaceae bacterium]